MTRFIFIADTHINADPQGYYQQPRYAKVLPELIGHLADWIQMNSGIDFVLHGGDMVDVVSPESINTACSLFRMPVPLYLCLGNHDMTHPRAAEMWRDVGSSFFPDGELDYTLQCDGAFIHVMSTHWCDTPLYWDRHALHPHFLPHQVRDLREAASTTTNIAHIICTHSEVAAVPISQTGFTEPYHKPLDSFANLVHSWFENDTSYRCVLSGHNHVNTCVPISGSDNRAVTVSAFPETPFEFKVVDLEPGRMVMRTENLASKCNFTAQYNYDKTFVQGRLKDRAFELRW